MASILATFNRALPFATPGTPLLQDLAHLAAICLFLYFAPLVQDWLQQRKPKEGLTNNVPAGTETTETDADTPVQQDVHAEVIAGPTEAAAEPNAQVPVGVQPDVSANGHDAVQDEDEDDENDTDMEDDATPRGTGSSDRNVGAKKAKSLARKDQRRAYHEFMRSQGEAQRARDAEGAAEREAALEAEKKRRSLAEAELAAKKAREREQKREAEQAEREAEYRRRESAVAMVKADLLARNTSDLHKVAAQVGGDVDEEWVEKVINASGIIGRKGDVLTMITSTGWAARVTADNARAFYEAAASAPNISDEHGYMEDSTLSQMLVSVLATPVLTADA